MNLPLPANVDQIVIAKRFTKRFTITFASQPATSMFTGKVAFTFGHVHVAR